jgi:hypothetical protein
MANPKDFFLPEVKGGYPDLRKALNTATKIERLIDGQNVYQAQEEAILAATDTILFVTWAFGPTMPVPSASAQKVAKNWGELLLLAASRVPVRILMTDQDPIFQLGAHLAAWGAYRTLVNVAKKLGISQDDFQVAVARHPADWPLGISGTLAAEQRLDAILDIAKASKEDPDFVRFPASTGIVGADRSGRRHGAEVARLVHSGNASREIPDH